MSESTSPARRSTGTTHALLRIVAGAVFAMHGMVKLFGVFEGFSPVEAGTQMWWGGLIEFTCGTLIALGLLTRFAAFLASGTMAVAYFQFHWKVFDPPFSWNFDGAFAERAFPIVNGGGPAIVFCFLFFHLVFTGAGPFSIDRLWRARRTKA